MTLARRVLGPAAPLELLRAGDAVVLRSPEGIVRVVPRELRDPSSVATEIVAARALAAAGAPIAAPLEGPHVFEAATVTLWADAPDTGDRRVGAYAAMGRALHAFHEVGGVLVRDGRLRVPPWEPLVWLRARLERVSGAVPRRLRQAVEERAGALSAPLEGEETLLHTDAHAGNFRVGPDGQAVLVDLEQLHRGPWRYDLAPMGLIERRYGGDPARWRAAVVAYGADPDDPELAPLLALRELLAIGWLLGLARERPDVVEVARQRLRDVEAGNDAAWVAV